MKIKLHIVVTSFLLIGHTLFSQITLSHNIGNDVEYFDTSTCQYIENIYYGRTFILNDFGVSDEEELVINSGEFGIIYQTWGATATFNIYEIDENFPDSFSESHLIGSSQTVRIYPSGLHSSEIFKIDFETPVIVPAGTKRILLEVKKGQVIPTGNSIFYLTGTREDRDISWQKNCTFGFSTGDGYQNLNETALRKVHKFYIVANGEDRIPSAHQMSFTTNCDDLQVPFALTNTSDITSVVWDFGDPTSGNNSDTSKTPNHIFSTFGTFEVTAEINSSDGKKHVVSESITLAQTPKAHSVKDLHACESVIGSGLSSEFDTSLINMEVIGNQTDVIVSYYDSNGVKLSNPLPNPLANVVKNSETITVRVASKSNVDCYAETTFNLIADPLPIANVVNDLVICADTNNGYGFFDLTVVTPLVVGMQTSLDIAYFDQSGTQIPVTGLSNYKNQVLNREQITVKVINPATKCDSETTINLIVQPKPIAYPTDPIFGCDYNNDGISEYFDTSLVEKTVLGNQTNMEVKYFDNTNLELPSPLQNPYSNITPYKEDITIRVIDPKTKCYAETVLSLETSSQPVINQPQPMYSCDNGDGFAFFDTTKLTDQIIGGQSGLRVLYFNNAGNPLPNPLPTSYQNTIPYIETLNIKVENSANASCFANTTLDLIVQKLPSIELQETYSICDLEPSLTITAATGFNSYDWQFENGTISNTNSVEIEQEGNYLLIVDQIENGIACSESFPFRLVRSELPKIIDVRTSDLSNNSFIEIIATGDGQFEYSIDGIEFQDSNYFDDIEGGVYTVYVRDKNGCGQDNAEVILMDYPKFFSPNNDGNNDHWHITGIDEYPNAIVYVYDRYGKLLKQLSTQTKGWDGTYLGKPMASSDYWFLVDLKNGKQFRSHFALVR